MVTVELKPLSINEAFQGRRFKTEKYKKFEKNSMLLLPKIKLPEPPFEVRYVFGFSNKASDADNPTKPLQDILQKKYKFNDKEIYRIIIDKVIVKKGKEFFGFEIKHLEI